MPTGISEIGAIVFHTALIIGTVGLFVMMIGFLVSIFDREKLTEAIVRPGVITFIVGLGLVFFVMFAEFVRLCAIGKM